MVKVNQMRKSPSRSENNRPGNSFFFENCEYLSVIVIEFDEIMWNSKCLCVFIDYLGLF